MAKNKKRLAASERRNLSNIRVTNVGKQSKVLEAQANKILKKGSKTAASKKDVRVVARRVAAKAKRLDFLGHEYDIAAMHTYADRFHGQADRLQAKIEGRKASIRIAKARALKEKKKPVTALAVEKNKQANRLSGGINTILKSAENKNFRKRTGINSRVWLDRSQAVKNLRKYDPENPAFSQAFELKQKQNALLKESKAAARKSGGISTAMKRNAEAGIMHIAKGQRLKSFARSAGVLSIAGMFAQHLAQNINKGKKNG